MQPISQASGTQLASNTSNTRSGGQDRSGQNNGVVLRWRESTRLSSRAQTSASHLNQAAAALEQAQAVSARAQVELTAASSPNTGSHEPTNSAWAANPLRDSGAAQPATRQAHYTRTTQGARPQSARGSERGAVRAAAYQNAGGTLDPFGDGNAQAPATLPPGGLPPIPSDPLSQPELAPPPPSSLPQASGQQPQLGVPQLNAPQAQLGMPQPSLPQPAMPQSGAPQSSGPQSGEPQRGQSQPSIMPELNESDLMPRPGAAGQPQVEEPSPFDRARQSGGQSGENGFDQLERRSAANASANCEVFRDRLRNATLDKINLKSGPRYGQGLGGDPEQAEKMRLDFASGAEERDWCDREGHALVRGRMVDLYNELVVLDVGGVRREIPLRDLCDVDLAYIGKAWNLPVSCGSGQELYAARGFVPSAIQWKASGLCHKPLYFEEVQLERYGHEIGPVLQPLVSTAHFFGNIAVLPYKMGIHPPHECQYALGYYRPGDCAPYMLPPIPWSLRGAAVEAGVITGAAGLIP